MKQQKSTFQNKDDEEEYLGSLILKRGMKPSEEQIRRIIENAPKSDDEIDYSDIPKMTKEELSRFRRVNPRKDELRKVAN